MNFSSPPTTTKVDHTKQGSCIVIVDSTLRFYERSICGIIDVYKSGLEVGKSDADCGSHTHKHHSIPIYLLISPSPPPAQSMRHPPLALANCQ